MSTQVLMIAPFCKRLERASPSRHTAYTLLYYNQLKLFQQTITTCLIIHLLMGYFRRRETVAYCARFPANSVDRGTLINNNNTNGNSIALSEEAVVNDDRKLDAEGALSAGPPKPTPFALRPNFSVRMTRRTELFAQRKRLSDYALVFGVSGIFLMVIETELTMAHVYEKVISCLNCNLPMSKYKF